MKRLTLALMFVVTWREWQMNVITDHAFQIVETDHEAAFQTSVEANAFKRHESLEDGIHRYQFKIRAVDSQS